MKTSELKPGRTFAVAFEHGDDFMSSLAAFCHDSGVRQGHIAMFLAEFSEADIVGTCDKPGNPQAPVWSKVHVSNVESLGCGTIARDDADGILDGQVRSMNCSDRDPLMCEPSFEAAPARLSIGNG